MNATDDQIVDRLCAKLAADLDGSFEEMVVAYQDRMYGFALRLTGDPADAEEIAQDAFVRAYRALRGYGAERVRTLSLKAWLYRITLNVARNRLRGKSPGSVSLDGDTEADPLDPADDESRGPEALWERAEVRMELGRRLAALPERYRAAVVLRYVSDLSYVEAADVLGQPVGTVKANVHRGIQLLRAAVVRETVADNTMAEVQL